MSILKTIVASSLIAVSAISLIATPSVSAKSSINCDKGCSSVLVTACKSWVWWDCATKSYDLCTSYSSNCSPVKGSTVKMDKYFTKFLSCESSNCNLDYWGYIDNWSQTKYKSIFK